MHGKQLEPESAASEVRLARVRGLGALVRPGQSWSSDRLGTKCPTGNVVRDAIASEWPRVPPCLYSAPSLALLYARRMTRNAGRSTPKERAEANTNELITAMMMDVVCLAPLASRVRMIVKLTV